MCDGDIVLPQAYTGAVRLTLFETAGCATLKAVGFTEEAAARRLTLFETAGCATWRSLGYARRISRLTLFETAGCATGVEAARFVAALPPHALRNRGMCDRAEWWCVTWS